MRFKAGDRVRIKSIDWYYENRDRIDEVICGNTNFIPDMVKYCGEIVTISSVLPTLEVYHIKEDGGMFNWTDEMIECKVEGIEDRMKELRKMCTISLTDNNYSDKIEVLLNDYEYIEENGKAYFVKKKTEYPKTYEECCKVLGVSEFEYNHTGTKVWYRHKLMATLDKLMLCRDAYWKIAGEEMGLGKPWKPDWTANDNHFYTIHTFNGKIECSATAHRNAVLIFPTEEMRDAFYEAFKKEIELVKELL